MADEAPRYPCGTISEMAAIPLEARPRFLAELPKLLEVCDQTSALNAITEPLGFALKMQTPIWVDDDKGTTTISISTPS